MQLSSRLTSFSKYSLVIFSLLATGLLLFEKNHYWWSYALSLFLVLFATAMFCFYSHLRIESDKLIFSKQFARNVEMRESDVEKVLHFKSKKYDFYFFETSFGGFVILGPLDKLRAEALKNLYLKLKK